MEVASRTSKTIDISRSNLCTGGLGILRLIDDYSILTIVTRSSFKKESVNPLVIVSVAHVVVGREFIDTDDVAQKPEQENSVLFGEATSFCASCLIGNDLMIMAIRSHGHSLSPIMCRHR